MSLGTLGSTLNDELNRLANGGTYRDSAAMVDEALAAKQWANRENISPYSTDTVGVLNEIAGLGLDKKNWLDFNGVCNYIAGTSGLPAAAALRQIYPTTDLLTGVASYYVDAATPTNWGSLGYVYLNGVAGNYLSTPDAAALDITGDIDIRVQVALDDWTPASAMTLISKYATPSSSSYLVQIASTGTPYLYWSPDGSTVLSKFSTVAPTITDGQPLWIRATLDVDNGSSGNDVKFFTSTDGTNWTQLGSTITTAGVTSIYNSTTPLSIGVIGTSSAPMVGKFYRAQILNGINGTTALDVNIATDYKSSNLDTFTATTGQTVTVNGVGTVANYGAAGSLLPTTVGSSTAADSNDAKFLDHTGTNYVYVPGTQLSNMSVPDGAAFDITGDIDLRAYVAMDDWTPSAISALVTKWDANQWSYSLSVDTNGTLLFDWSATGSLAINKNSTVATGLTDGTAKWVRATLDVDNGASGNTVTFYTSDNGTSWTQLGSAVTTAGVTSIYSGTANVIIGARTQGFGQSSAAKIYRAQILNGIGGTTVLDVDTSVITAGSATSFTAVTGQTVTINRSTSGRKSVAVTQPTWLFGTDDYMEVNNRYMAHSTAAENYVYLSGASGNYMSVSDNPPLDVTADLDLRAKISLDNWSSGASQTIVSKRTSIGNQRSYRMVVSGTGGIFLEVSADGTATTVISSTTITSFAAGATKWIRATFDSDNGAGGNTTKFFTSDDGVTWTQLGADVVNSGVFTIYSGTAAVELGSCNGGLTDRATGKIFRGQILNGIDGTVVLDADASVITLPSQTTFVDRSSNAYTVTINKSGVGTFVSTGNYLYLPGIASNYASAPDSAAVSVTGDIDLRCKVALDDWTPTSLPNQLICRWTSSGNLSYQFRVMSAGNLEFGWTADGTTQNFVNSTVAPTVTDGATLWVRVTFDVDNTAGGNTATFYTSSDGTTWTQLGSAVTTAGVTSIFDGNAILEIGTRGSGATAPSRGKFFRAQVLNGIGGTLVFDANFENSITSLLQTSFTESSTNGATVTINRSGSTFRSAGVIDAGYLYPGATNTFSNSTTDFLDFTATQSLTVFGVFRQWATQSNGRIVDKRSSSAYSSGQVGYSLNNDGATQVTAFLGDGVDISFGPYYKNISLGSIALYALSVNRDTNKATAYYNNNPSTTGDIPLIGDLTNVFPLSIGRWGGQAGNYADMEFIGAAVFRQALTATQIRQITNYFINREVYL